MLTGDPGTQGCDTAQCGKCPDVAAISGWQVGPTFQEFQKLSVLPLVVRSQPTRNSGAGRGVGKLLTGSFTKTKRRGCKLSTVGAIEGVRAGPGGPWATGSCLR